MAEDDALSHFDKLNSDHQAQKASDKTSADDAKAEREKNNARVNAVFKAVVETKISSLKRGLAPRGVALQELSIILTGGDNLQLNRVSFHLCNVGEENTHGRPRTREYNIYLKDNDEVSVTRGDGRGGQSEDLRTAVGTVSVPEITEAYVNEVVKLAIDEWFKVKDKPMPRQR